MNKYSTIKLISAWNDRKLEDKIKLEIDLFIRTLPSCSTLDVMSNITDNFSASFDKLGNIEVNYFITDVIGSQWEDLIKTKLFKHPVLLQDVEPVINEISGWLLEMHEEYGGDVCIR